MVKYIKNKKYNTETAQELGRYDNIADCQDFNHFSETLYIKKTGEYFLYCEGGPYTDYGINQENKSGYGKSIRRLSFDDARNWAMNRLSGEEYEKIFGEVEEDGSKAYLNLYLPKTNINKLKKIAREQSMTPSEYINCIIVKLQQF